VACETLEPGGEDERVGRATIVWMPGLFASRFRGNRLIRGRRNHTAHCAAEIASPASVTRRGGTLRAAVSLERGIRRAGERRRCDGENANP